jgi:hypothetical protein
MFVNPEFFVQIHPGDQPPGDTSWFCDILAVNLREKKVYLCEVTYSKSLAALTKRLTAWARDWGAVRQAICRDANVPAGWEMQPYVFIPKVLEPNFRVRIADLENAQKSGAMPYPGIKHLEDVVPWTYRSWDRREPL